MPEGIKDKVCIVGMGCTKFGENWDKSDADMIVDAAYEAYEDAGIEPKDVQAYWMGTCWGMTAAMLSMALKSQYKPVTRVENACATGAEALRNACYAVASGAYDIALALGYEKLKDQGISGLGGTAVTTGVASVMTAPGAFAMLATKYFARYGLSPSDGKRMIAQIPVNSHSNGSLNPKAHYQNKITVDQVLNAPIIAWPLSILDSCGVSDGAAAAIVVRAEDAKKFRTDPVYKSAADCRWPRQGPDEPGLRLYPC